MMGDKVVGVAFEAFDDLENIGYIVVNTSARSLSFLSRDLTLQILICCYFS